MTHPIKSDVTFDYDQSSGALLQSHFTCHRTTAIDHASLRATELGVAFGVERQQLRMLKRMEFCFQFSSAAA